MTRTIVLHDADRIQDYIFTTGKLREIRGASALVDSLTTRSPSNEEPTELDRLLKNYQGCEPVYAGGGNLVLWFDDEAVAKQFDLDYSRRFFDATRQASTTGVVYPTTQPYLEAFDVAMARLQSRKAASPGPPFLEAGGLLRPCQSCGLQPASTIELTPDDLEERICAACHEKRQSAKKDLPRIYRQFFQSADEWRKRFSLLPSDFGDIGRASRPDGYLGVIYCDGDAIGERIRTLRSKAAPDEQEQAYRDFSRRLDEATRSAIVEVLRERYSAPTGVASGQTDAYYPFQIILCGGDDLLIVVPADAALDIAAAYVERFAQKTGDMTTSAGIVLAHERHPFRELARLAKEALKSAKKLSREIKGQKQGCIDCVVVKASAAESLDHERQRAYATRDNRCDLAPGAFTLDDYNKTKRVLDQLKQSAFPTTKLHAIAASLSRGYLKSLLSYADSINRARPEHRKVMEFIEKEYGLTRGPWMVHGDDKRTSPYVRLSEWYRFFSGGSEADQ